MNGAWSGCRRAAASTLALLALAGCAWIGPAAQHESDLDVFGAAPIFALTDQLGRPVTSDDLRGKVVVANFIYTTCQDTCPLLSRRMQALQKRLRDEQLLGTRVQLLSFTVDPARDTVPVLQAYAEQHGADPAAWRFLTGPEQYVVPLIVQGFKLGVQPQAVGAGQAHATGRMPQGAYDVMHSNRVVLIDGQGQIRAYYDGLQVDDQQVLRDIRRLVR